MRWLPDIALRTSPHATCMNAVTESPISLRPPSGPAGSRPVPPGRAEAAAPRPRAAGLRLVAAALLLAGLLAAPARLAAALGHLMARGTGAGADRPGPRTAQADVDVGVAGTLPRCSDVCQFVRAVKYARHCACGAVIGIMRIREAIAWPPRFAHRFTVGSPRTTVRRDPHRELQPCARLRPAAALLAGGVLLAVQSPALAQANAAVGDALPVSSLLWGLRATVGSWVVLMVVVCVLVWRGAGLQGTRWRFALWACVLTLPLPWVAMISGWLALELGQRPHVGAALASAQAEAPAQSGGAALLAWGCAYAVLMMLNLRLSLRWLRLDSGLSQDSQLADARPSSPLVKGLSQRYEASEFQSSQFRRTGDRSEPPPLANGARGKTYDVDKLRRAVARLRKERNALRQVVKASAGKRSDPPATRPPPPALPPPQEEGGDTQMIPVLRDVIQLRRH
jgi:hypothetical protein